MMKKRNFQVNKYVIMEPGAINYSANMPTTVYRHGQIDGFDGKTVVINAGGEHLDLFQESFDTLMVSERSERALRKKLEPSSAQNGYRRLHSLLN